MSFPSRYKWAVATPFENKASAEIFMERHKQEGYSNIMFYPLGNHEQDKFVDQEIGDVRS